MARCRKSVASGKAAEAGELIRRQFGDGFGDSRTDLDARRDYDFTA